jgi:hypothetical protein
MRAEMLVGTNPLSMAAPRKQRIQRAPARKPAPVQAGAFEDYADFLDGFQELAVAAINKGGRTLDTVRLGGRLSQAHRRSLEQIRSALILAQEPSPESRRTAIARWPALEANLHNALADARRAGVSDKSLAAVADTIALVGEKYIRVPRRGPSQVESAEGYTDLFTGLQALIAAVSKGGIDKRHAVIPLNIAQINKDQRAELRGVKFGGQLTRRHRALLEKLRTALIYARTETRGSARKALAEWQDVQGQLQHVFERASTFVEGDTRTIQSHLRRVGAELIWGGVYAEAHNEARKQVDLQPPNLAYQVEKFKRAAEEVKTARELAGKVGEATGETILDKAFEAKGIEGVAGDILKLVESPGDIAEKLEEFKKQGVVGQYVTVAELADKLLSVRNSLLKVSFVTMQQFAKGALAQAMKANDAVAIKRWWTVEDWAGKHLATLKKVEKAATVIGVVVSAIKVVDYLRQEKWGAALQEAAETAGGLVAARAGGLSGTIGYTAVYVVIWAEMEGLKGHAAMIRWAREQNVREAAGAYIDECMEAAEFPARAILADVKLLNDPSNADLKPLIDKRMDMYNRSWMEHLGDLSQQLSSTRSNTIGGQPKLKEALGADAQRILNSPGTWAKAQVSGDWTKMADEIKTIFAGANSMAEYVVKNYLRKAA